MPQDWSPRVVHKSDKGHPVVRTQHILTRPTTRQRRHATDDTKTRRTTDDGRQTTRHDDSTPLDTVGLASARLGTTLLGTRAQLVEFVQHAPIWDGSTSTCRRVRAAPQYMSDMIAVAAPPISRGRLQSHHPFLHPAKRPSHTSERH